MRLGEKQELFAQLLPRLIDRAHIFGFQVRMGDLYRDPRYHGDVGEHGALWITDMLSALGIGAPREMYGYHKSCHKLKLAVDLNLFFNGEFLQKTSDHEELGEWWEQQHELCRWGGRFNDGNHYSLEHNGMK